MDESHTDEHTVAGAGLRDAFGTVLTAVSDYVSLVADLDVISLRTDEHIGSIHTQSPSIEMVILVAIARIQGRYSLL